MKLVLILCDQSRGQEMMELLEGHDVHGYTQVPMVLGSGITGKANGDTCLARERMHAVCPSGK